MKARRANRMLQKLREALGHTITDHAEMKEGKIFTHPYPTDMVHFERLIQFCKANGLSFFVDGASEYSLGTFKITIDELETL